MPTPPYHGFIVSGEPLEAVTGKWYRADIRRPTMPALTREWSLSGLDPREIKEAFEEEFVRRGRTLIPRLAISFPHVTRVYTIENPTRGGAQETNFGEALLYDTQTQELIDAKSIGCDAEIAVLGQERERWRAAESVEQWLGEFTAPGSLGAVANPNKLADYIARNL